MNNNKVEFAFLHIALIIALGATHEEVKDYLKDFTQDEQAELWQRVVKLLKNSRLMAV